MLLAKEAADIQPEEASEAAAGTCSERPGGPPEGAGWAGWAGWARGRWEKWVAAACIHPECACGTMDLPDSAAIHECSGEWKWGRHIWEELDPATAARTTRVSRRHTTWGGAWLKPPWKQGRVENVAWALG